MLPEKADIHVQQVGLLCTGKLRSSFIRFFFPDFSCNTQPFFARLSPATFVFVFASASLIKFGLDLTLTFSFIQLYSKKDDFHCVNCALSAPD